ncbi:MAG: alkaline phosphatase family protein [Candidatus Kapabacteria bacterium]|nr:alkaline phosphatase family protein [Candidatus Kapabacteria bacterium]
MKQQRYLWLAVCLTAALIHISTNAQTLLQSGPMVGAVQMREAKLWAQTTAPARVHFMYYDSATPARRYTTDTVRTEKLAGFTATCIADSVLPGRTYFYELHINGKRVQRPYPMRFRTPANWLYRTQPPALRFALGSCTYINDEPYDRSGKPYGGDYGIFTAIARTKPDLMLWLGDNTYLRPADEDTRTGIFHRYTHTRSLPEMQPLLAACSNIAIWDDHDYGPNDSDRGFAGKDETRRAFTRFWANPSYGIGERGGITSMFSTGDMDIFLLDNRWYRSPDGRKGGERTILGKEQFDWLIDNLVSSNATFKLVCIGGQVLNSAALYENYATYPAERSALIDAIHKENIRGVIFLTGDRHHTELSLLKQAGEFPIYDFTVSPLTSGPNEKAATEANSLRVDGTFVGKRNFATIDVAGEQGKRMLTLTVYDSAGVMLWTREISAESLKQK